MGHQFLEFQSHSIFFFFFGMNTPHKERSLSLPQRPLLQSSSSSLDPLMWLCSGSASNTAVCTGDQFARPWGQRFSSNAIKQARTLVCGTEAFFSGRRSKNTGKPWSWRAISGAEDFVFLGEAKSGEEAKIDVFLSRGQPLHGGTQESARYNYCTVFYKVVWI